ncbi:MAG: glutamine-hydrolyzing carbamoyl-phosphate synthase small subunit [Actinobacteria bacterium]|nr:glutamine-hydrolyzing carbamoyl-phosphate synthase small subunit [Actinomycetota bacterium]
MNKPGLLVLEDGAVFRGYSFGAPVDAGGEVVFNTSMTGYQEVATDPSYHGQMVVFTYPLIGNYGVTAADHESMRPWAAAIIVREYCAEYSNWRAEGEFHDFLACHGIPGLHGVDTRALTRHLRTYGTMRAMLVQDGERFPREALVEQARAVQPLSERPLVAESSVDTQCPFSEGRPRIVLVDCGLKQNIARSLARRGAEVVIVPHNYTAEQILALSPRGVVVSNGPGDPATLPWIVEMTRGLLAADMPLLGICLGHQILGQAIGAKTGRLKFGHHGGNHPVKDLTTGQVHITSQNHEYQVLEESVPRESGFFVSHVNLNDGSVEGLAHPTRPAFSVQYHPEGSPGPQDNQYIFNRFLALVQHVKTNGVPAR